MDITKDTRKNDQIGTKKMIRLIVQTKRKYKMKTSKKANADERPEKDEKDPKENESNCITDEELGEGSKESSDCEQDSDVSSQEDRDEEIDKEEMEEEDWLEYIKRSTNEAEEYMTKTKIPCWIETHRRMKWRMAMRIASLPEDRWSSKIIEWNPALDCTIKTNRLVGMTKKKDGKTKSMNT